MFGLVMVLFVGIRNGLFVEFMFCWLLIVSGWWCRLLVEFMVMLLEKLL